MPNTPALLIAGGNIPPFVFVKQDTAEDHQGLIAGANDLTIGIAGSGTQHPPLSDLVTTNYHAVDGQPIRLQGDGDTKVLLQMGATCSAGDRLKAHTDGTGVPIATTGTTIQNVGARALEACTAIGQLIEVEIYRDSVRPALA